MNCDESNKSYLSTIVNSGSSTSYSTLKHQVYLAVGSNLGDRFQNIRSALNLLCDDGKKTRLVKTSFLYETPPMYVSNQPRFLNGAVEVETNLEPPELLQRIKEIESQLGRDFNTIQNGPRPVDLDILFYHKFTKSCDGTMQSQSLVLHDTQCNLEIPHPRMQERAFVMQPLVEVASPNLIHPTLNATLRDMLQALNNSNEKNGAVVRVLPLHRDRMLYLNKTIVMGILNVTPDSFSDGGIWNTSIDKAAHYALEMERDGANIIDVGGESTRPGANSVAVDEEIKRVVPVIELIRQASNVPISIDTRHSKVAKAAISAGADIVNDVSGGTYDTDMLTTVAQLGVPIVLMHMRGTPTTMQSMSKYDDVVSEVSSSLQEASLKAVDHGIHRWLHVVDPGIGFAKNLNGNILLLRNLDKLRSVTGNVPILIGTSRKGFIGTLTGVAVAAERDPGSIASCLIALCLDESVTRGCNILRVHNVKDCSQAVKVMDAILTLH